MERYSLLEEKTEEKPLTGSPSPREKVSSEKVESVMDKVSLLSEAWITSFMGGSLFLTIIFIVMSIIESGYPPNALLVVVGLQLGGTGLFVYLLSQVVNSHPAIFSDNAREEVQAEVTQNVRMFQVVFVMSALVSVFVFLMLDQMFLVEMQSLVNTGEELVSGEYLSVLRRNLYVILGSTIVSSLLMFGSLRRLT